MWQQSPLRDHPFHWSSGSSTQAGLNVQKVQKVDKSAEMTHRLLTLFPEKQCRNDHSCERIGLFLNLRFSECWGFAPFCRKLRKCRKWETEQKQRKEALNRLNGGNCLPGFPPVSLVQWFIPRCAETMLFNSFARNVVLVPVFPWVNDVQGFIHRWYSRGWHFCTFCSDE